MSENGKITIPDHAHGHLVYMGRDQLEDVQGAMATIGAALHFAADHVRQFRDETNAAHQADHEHGEAEDGCGGDDPSTEAYYRALVFAHALASPGCVEPMPPLPEEGSLAPGGTDHDEHGET